MKVRQSEAGGGIGARWRLLLQWLLRLWLRLLLLLLRRRRLWWRWLLLLRWRV